MDKPRSRYRLLHVIDHLGLGGAQEVVCHLVKYGQRSRFQVEVAALHGYGHFFGVLRSYGVPVYSLCPHDHAALALPLIARRLGRLVRRGRYELVHCHLFGATVLGNCLAALNRVPVRFTHDQTNDDARRRSAVIRRLDILGNRLTHHIIAVSSSIRDFLCREEGIPLHKISVIHNAVDLGRFSPPADLQGREAIRRTWGIPANGLVVGGVGRLRPQKNFPLFLEVAARVSTAIPEARFVIAGDGPERAALEALTQKLGLASRVRFAGLVTDMPSFYQGLDLLVLTSHFEGTPLTVLEAMAMGVPVVASRVDGAAEILTHGRDGCLVPPGERERFVAEVSRLLRDADRRRRLGRAGRETVQRRHSAEAMVRQVEALYLRFLEGDREPA